MNVAEFLDLPLPRKYARDAQGLAPSARLPFEGEEAGTL